jgi:hypothetical protein
MAIASYLMRREGRYSLQIRYSAPLAAIMGRPLHRSSLRTADYRVAQMRLTECLRWVHRMNSWMNAGFNVTDDDHDPSSIGEHPTSPLSTMRIAIHAQLTEFVSDSWPLELDRLVARQSFETWYLQAASKLDLIEGTSLLNDHAISPKRKLFESQNAQASFGFNGSFLGESCNHWGQALEIIMEKLYWRTFGDAQSLLCFRCSINGLA